MQNKGFVKFLAVALTLICLFYLSFGFVTKYVEDKAAKMEEKEAELYLDSLNSTPFYLGNYTLKDCRETGIGLGLDLKGGMNVILEVSVPDVVKALADHKTDEAFLKSVSEAAKEAQESQSDFITLFVKAYKKNAPGKPLAGIFATQQLKGKVNTNSSDADSAPVSTDSVSFSLTFRRLKDRAVVSWWNSLVSRSLSVYVNSFRVVQTLSSGRHTMLHRLLLTFHS